MPRIEYEGQMYPVTEEEVPDEDAVRSFLKFFSQRAANADVEVDVQDGEKVYRVTARAAGKGNHLKELIASLEEESAFTQPAIAMAAEMEGMDATELLFQRDRIRKAYEGGKAEYESMVNLKKAIAEVGAIPSETVPIGF
jgi:hypothetical protein